MKKTVFALLLLLCVGIAPVFACLPTITPSPIPNSGATPSPMSLEERALDASMVFVGTVIGAELCGAARGYICEAEIEVERYLKGNGQAIVWVRGFGGNTDCRPLIEMGERRIFFVRGTPDETMDLLFFGYSQAIPFAGDEEIARIVAVTNQSTAPEGMPLDTRARLLSNRYAAQLIPSALILIGLIVIALFWLRRGRRKSKAKREI
jgi:hypothetical protein